jgi:hypothetical protein
MQKAIKLNWNYRLDTQGKEALIHQNFLLLACFIDIRISRAKLFNADCHYTPDTRRARCPVAGRI